jgi:hypothetical protein
MKTLVIAAGLLFSPLAQSAEYLDELPLGRTVQNRDTGESIFAVCSSWSGSTEISKHMDPDSAPSVECESMQWLYRASVDDEVVAASRYQFPVSRWYAKRPVIGKAGERGWSPLAYATAGAVVAAGAGILFTMPGYFDDHLGNPVKEGPNKARRIVLISVAGLYVLPLLIDLVRWPFFRGGRVERQEAQQVGSAAGRDRVGDSILATLTPGDTMVVSAREFKRIRARVAKLEVAVAE